MCVCVCVDLSCTDRRAEVTMVSLLVGHVTYLDRRVIAMYNRQEWGIAEAIQTSVRQSTGPGHLSPTESPRVRQSDTRSLIEAIEWAASRQRGSSQRSSLSPVGRWFRDCQLVPVWCRYAQSATAATRNCNRSSTSNAGPDGVGRTVSVSVSVPVPVPVKIVAVVVDRWNVFIDSGINVTISFVHRQRLERQSTTIARGITVNSVFWTNQFFCCIAFIP